MPSQTAAKCTFLYQQGLYGWTESYFTLKTIQDAYAACLPLGNALIALRGENTAITGIRISQVLCPTNQPPNPRSAQLFPPLNSWSSGGATITFSGGPISDTFSASVLARCIPATPQPGTKSIYMGGMPDAYDKAGGTFQFNFTYNYGVAPIRALQRALWQGAFGWLGITASPAPASVPIGNLSVSTTGLVSITVSNTAALLAALGSIQRGQVIPLRISNVRQPGNMNGTWPFRFLGGTASTLFVSVKSFATLTWDLTGSVTYSPKNFIPFIQANVGVGNPTPAEVLGNIYAEKIARRKRGLPFGVERGRQKVIKRF